MLFPSELILPQKTIFKKGAHKNIAAECLEFGRRGLIVHGKSLELNGRQKKIEKQLFYPARVNFFCRRGEPTLEEIGAAVTAAKKINADWICGIGGGSAIDVAKAAAGLYHAGRPAVFYQKGGALERKGIPFIAVPTTAGTGSEATPNAVITNAKTKAKLSIRDKSFMARKVILDVTLLTNLPKKAIAYSGMDALVQAYEAYISKNASWLTDTLAEKAIALINKHIVPAYRTRGQKHLSAMLLASYFGGIALAHARLGVVHGIAHPLGAIYNQPHGLICAVCLPASIKLNKKAMGEKYAYLSRLAGKDFLKRTGELLNALAISSPFKNETIIEKENIIAQVLASGSTAANPKPIKRYDVERILNEIF